MKEITTQNNNEIDVQISTARRYPRKTAEFIDKATSMCTYNKSQAAACVYSVPRAGTKIMGPSVRLAEIAAYCWGNLHCATRIIDQTDKDITAEAVAWDLENNVRIITQVKRSILDKNGNTFRHDMIITSGNAASSIALRNAILKVIPKTFINDVYEKALSFAFGNNGKQKTIEERIKIAFDLFKDDLNISSENVLKIVKKSHEKDITLKDLEYLLGAYTGIKESGHTYEDYIEHEEIEPKTQKENLDELTSILEN